ncbi:MAG TPA: DUF1080 domain-containing protein [Planctomycetaceae bacterium]|nr:DUF1080 domain-containing protein [Planctomycetaceae bacterium]
MRMIIAPGLAAFVCFILSTAARADDEFHPLFDGKTLDGWEQHGGKARYHVEGEEIVGTSVPNTPNSFLCTKEQYGDFILELEFKVDKGLNSGVQIRSQVFDKETEIDFGNGTKKKVAADRVHGYQVEIDPSDRAWTAGIYDEGRRGWLNTLEKNQPAREAFRQNEWNQLRVVCQGDRLQTWLNGVPAADLTDGLTPRGLIALQVHGVGDKAENVGKQVRWRKIRLKKL